MMTLIIAYLIGLILIICSSGNLGPMGVFCAVFWPALVVVLILVSIVKAFIPAKFRMDV